MKKKFLFCVLIMCIQAICPSCSGLIMCIQAICSSPTENRQIEDGAKSSASSNTLVSQPKKSRFLSMSSDTVHLEGTDMSEQQALLQLTRKLGMACYLVKCAGDGTQIRIPASEAILDGDYNVIKAATEHPVCFLENLIAFGDLKISVHEQYGNQFFVDYKGLRLFLILFGHDVRKLRDYLDFVPSGDVFYFLMKGLKIHDDRTGVNQFHQNNTFLDVLYCVLFIGDNQDLITTRCTTKEDLTELDDLTCLEDLIRFAPILEELLALCAFAKHGKFYKQGVRLILEDGEKGLKLIPEDVYQGLYYNFLEFLNRNNVINKSEFDQGCHLVAATHKVLRLINASNDTRKLSTTHIKSGRLYADNLMYFLPLSYQARISRKSDDQKTSQNTVKQLLGRVKKLFTEFVTTEKSGITDDDIPVLQPWIEAGCRSVD